MKLKPSRAHHTRYPTLRQVSAALGHLAIGTIIGLSPLALSSSVLAEQPTESPEEVLPLPGAPRPEEMPLPGDMVQTFAYSLPQEGFHQMYLSKGGYLSFSLYFTNTEIDEAAFVKRNLELKDLVESVLYPYDCEQVSREKDKIIGELMAAIEKHFSIVVYDIDFQISFCDRYDMLDGGMIEPALPESIESSQPTHQSQAKPE